MNKTKIGTWIAASSCCLVESKSDRMEPISVRSREFSDCESSHSWNKNNFRQNTKLLSFFYRTTAVSVSNQENFQLQSVKINKIFCLKLTQQTPAAKLFLFFYLLIIYFSILTFEITLLQLLCRNALEIKQKIKYYLHLIFKHLAILSISLLLK